MLTKISGLKKLLKAVDSKIKGGKSIPHSFRVAESIDGSKLVTPADVPVALSRAVDEDLHVTSPDPRPQVHRIDSDDGILEITVGRLSVKQSDFSNPERYSKLLEGVLRRIEEDDLVGQKRIGFAQEVQVVRHRVKEEVPEGLTLHQELRRRQSRVLLEVDKKKKRDGKKARGIIPGSDTVVTEARGNLGLNYSSWTAPLSF